jgi:hypothetical protein
MMADYRKRELHVIPFNKFRYRLLVSIWPLCFAAFLATQALYGMDLEGKDSIELLFHTLSWVAFVLMVTTAALPRKLWIRMSAGLACIGVSAFRMTWLLDPTFVPSQKLFAGSIYVLVIVSALGWVMAADYAVVSSKIRDRSGQ